MPVEKEITERYLTWCSKWGVPYPCRKTRTAIRWCYHFSIWRETFFFNFVTHTACEDGIEYSWKQYNGLFIKWGSLLHTNVEKCFRNKLKDNNKRCSLEGSGFPVIE